MYDRVAFIRPTDLPEAAPKSEGEKNVKIRKLFEALEARQLISEGLKSWERRNSRAFVSLFTLIHLIHLINCFDTFTDS